MKHRLRELAIRGAVAGAALLIACTGGDGDHGSPTPAATETAATATVAIARPTAPSDHEEVKLGQIRIEKAITPMGLSLILASDQSAPVSERMPTRIDRATFDQGGVAHVETLLEARELGWTRFLTIAVAPDGEAMAVTQCTRGDCALMGSAPSADAQTTLERSVDGGEIWKVWTVLDGAYSAIAFVGDELLLSRFIGVEQTSQGGRYKRTYSRYPSGNPVEEPAGSYGNPPFVTRPGGEILWQSGDRVRCVPTEQWEQGDQARGRSVEEGRHRIGAAFRGWALGRGIVGRRV